MLGRSQLVSGRGGAQPGWHTAIQREKQGHRPVTLPGCVFATDVSLALQWTPASQCAPPKLSPASARCEHPEQWCVRPRCCAGTRDGCSGRHKLAAEDDWPKNYKNQVASEILHLFLHSYHQSVPNLPGFLPRLLTFLRTLTTFMLSLSRARWVMCCLKAMIWSILFWPVNFTAHFTAISTNRS